MSKSVLWGGGVLVLLVLAGGAWYWSGHFTPNVPEVPGSSATSTERKGISQENASSGTQGGASANGSTSYDADLSGIDSQMSGFDSDNASMDSGMNDQQVQQSSL